MVFFHPVRLVRTFRLDFRCSLPRPSVLREDFRVWWVRVPRFQRRTISTQSLHPLEKVNEVDIFISHTWTSDRWLKYAALCFDLNFHLALGVSITTWMSVIGFLVIGGISTWGGSRYLVLAGVYAPTLLFFTVFFFGHKLRSFIYELPTVWLDKACIHQTNEPHESAAGECTASLRGTFSPNACVVERHPF